MARLTTLKPRVQTLGAQQSNGWSAPHRGSRHERGYGWQWEQLRERILLRDCGMCQPCQRAGRVTAAKAVDHIVPKSQGGSDDERNLEGTCNECHAIKTQRESRGG
jgi:5-methylcytosine-specific restriction protein A